MMPLLSLLDVSPYLEPLTSLTGWLGWVFLLGMVIAALNHWRHYQARGERRVAFYILLVVLVPLTSLFLGVRLPAGAALPVPGIPEAPHSPAMMLFSSLPWMLAGGFMGPFSAAILGALVGLARGLWDTHNVFSLLEPVVLALLFSVAVRQRYRSRLYRAMRQQRVRAWWVLLKVGYSGESRCSDAEGKRECQ